MASMRKQYGSKKGEEVFYASKNKGTIEGVEKTEETRPMSYLEKLLENRKNRRAPARKINRDEPDTDRYTTGGRTGQPTTSNRLIKAGPTSRRNTGQATALAPSMVKQYTAGPKGTLPGRREDSSTEYKRMGVLMAEALGHRVDEIAPLLAAPLAAAGKVGALAARGLAQAGMAAGRAAGTAVKAGARAAGQAAKTGARAAGRAAKRTATDVATNVASNMADKMQKKPEEKEMEESIWNLYRDMALILAEEFAGRIAREYGTGRMRSSGTDSDGNDSDEKARKKARKMDPLVSREAEEAQANVRKRLKVKRVNLRKQDAVQAALNRRRARARRRTGGSGENLTPADKEALAKHDVNLRSGDKP